MLEVDNCERIEIIDEWLNGIIFDTSEKTFESGESTIPIEECDKIFHKILKI